MANALDRMGGVARSCGATKPRPDRLARQTGLRGARSDRVGSP